MPGKIPLTIQDQLSLLLQRNMTFRDITAAPHFLANISYYRLKGYWWEMQIDFVNHNFKHYQNHPDDYPEAWKGLEVVTLGTLSKIFDDLNPELPEKSKIANEFELKE